MQKEQYSMYHESCFLLGPLYAYSGWYFRSRDGATHGPFPHKDEALQAASEYTECAQRDDKGGGVQ